MFIQHLYTKRLLLLVSGFMLFSCSKITEIPEPKNTLTTVKVFNNDAQANGAMAGVLTTMINGQNNSASAYEGFATGMISLFTSFSSDDLLNTGSVVDGSAYIFNKNALDAKDYYVTRIWSSAYQTVYGANAIIEGIEASTSPTLRAKVRTELTAEAKFIRAFSYFYLVNTYGDVPLALTVDFNKLVTMARTPSATVYQQMVKDLTDAIRDLPADYSAGGGERIRPNKWAAKALLARVYLFMGQNNQAIVEASDVITQNGLYKLETADLNQVFLKNSAEAIWQLQQSTTENLRGTATPEAYSMLPNPLHTGANVWTISSSLMNAFEAGDLRKSNWIDSTTFTPKTAGGVPTKSYFSFKYKTGAYNRKVGEEPTEYSMVLRLAEQYLIRAEARALSGQTALAIGDLNIIRNRAGLPPLPTTLNKDQTLAAVAKERQTELFVEWGHRWYDLKRTGKAEAVLSILPIKQPWRGSYQLLYPIPAIEIARDRALIQNPNY